MFTGKSERRVLQDTIVLQYTILAPLFFKKVKNIIYSILFFRNMKMNWDLF